MLIKYLALFYYYSSKAAAKIWVKLVRRPLATAIARAVAVKCGKNLAVNGKCAFRGRVYIGDGCNFNGMTIIGTGETHFGNYFHSGTECMIITENHNYEGERIPYDATYVRKKVEIDECVWFGNPAKVIKYRDIEHFDKLYEKKMFFGFIYNPQFETGYSYSIG